MSSHNIDRPHGSTRRDFLKKGTIAAAGAAASSGLLNSPVYGTKAAPSIGTVLGANDRISVGFIGVGGQGFNGHIRNVLDHGQEHNVVGAAVCDVYEPLIDRARVELDLDESDAYRDHRQLLEREDIDAVFVSTVDHWHAQITIDALDAGKHVYLEKPMTRYLDEAFRVYDRVRASDRVFQYGSQLCSDARWHKAAELVREGKIGAPVLGQMSYVRNNPDGEWNYPIDPALTPETLDWNRWLGPVSDRPFSADEYFRWKKYHPYNAGIIGNLLPHRLAPLMISSGNPEYPRRVVCLGTKKITPDRDIPDNTQALAEFPSGLTILVLGSTVNEQGLPEIMRGHEASIHFGGNRVSLTPERAFADFIDPEEFMNLEPQGSVADHQWNFYQAIRTGSDTRGTIDIALKIQTVISLAEMSERLGQMLYFDPETRRITNGSGEAFPPITYGSLPQS